MTTSSLPHHHGSVSYVVHNIASTHVHDLAIWCIDRWNMVGCEYCTWKELILKHRSNAPSNISLSDQQTHQYMIRYRIHGAATQERQRSGSTEAHCEYLIMPQKLFGGYGRPIPALALFGLTQFVSISTIWTNATIRSQ